MATSPRVLLVEDEPGLLITLRDLLENAGYQVHTERDGEAGFRAARTQRFHLIVLDVMLPKKSGLDICRELRRSGADIPLLMLTAKSQTEDRVLGLKLGADDYLSKPFDPEELLARIEAVLRRANPERRPRATTRFGNVEADFARAEVRKADQPVNLAQKELQLLQYFVEHHDRIVTRDEVLQNVWNYSSEVSSRTIDVHVAWLRQKLEDNPQEPKHILTVRGRGYRFSA